TYVSLRRPEDGRIDWNRSAVEVCNFIRAQTRPYPGAFTHLPPSKLLRIWRATVFPYPYYGVPGLVGQKANNGVVVSCGDGAVVAEQLMASQVRATWFVTHMSPAISRLRRNPELFELGIHPNFLPGSTHGDTPDAVLRHCRALVPDAVSMRTHCLVQSTLLLE